MLLAVPGSNLGCFFIGGRRPGRPTVYRGSIAPAAEMPERPAEHRIYLTNVIGMLDN
jgi:hypothetical protein